MDNKFQLLVYLTRVFLVLMHQVLYSRAVHQNMATFCTKNHDIIDTVALCCIRT